MLPLHAPATLNAFFAQLAAAPQRALLLDYDGTLAPFHVERDQAFPYPGVRELLTTLVSAAHTRVIIVSGRALADLIALLAIDPLPELWGSHGWEHQLPDGTVISPTLTNEAIAGIAAAQHVACAYGLEHTLERKPVGIAVHWRGLAPKAAAGLHAEIGQLWEPITRRYHLDLHPFDGGLELRAPGRNKGTAVQTVLATLGSEVALAYLGDDQTDEDAFRAIGARGLRVLVRAKPRPSAADLWLRPPDELREFLTRWASIETPHATL
jgi:trehalose-phosphatase